MIPAGKTATVSFKVTISSDAKESDQIENVALVKVYGDDIPEDPWIPENFVPTNETVHPLNPWVETTYTVDVEKVEPEGKEPDKETPEKPAKEKETKPSPKSESTPKDEGSIGPKGGVQTGIQSHELLYAAIAAGLAFAAVIVHRRRKKKLH